MQFTFAIAVLIAFAGLTACTSIEQSPADSSGDCAIGQFNCNRVATGPGTH